MAVLRSLPAWCVKFSRGRAYSVDSRFRETARHGRKFIGENTKNPREYEKNRDKKPSPHVKYCSKMNDDAFPVHLTQLAFEAWNEGVRRPKCHIRS